jgi:hypothetical protein
MIKTFGAGEKAYHDAHTHVFPCTVLEVLEPGNGSAVTSGKLRIRVDKTTGPYAKGEVLTVRGFHTFPRSCRVVRRGFIRINPNYRWA